MRKDEEGNIAQSKSVIVTAVSVVMNKRRKDIEEALSNNDFVDDYEIEDLDEKDIRKEVFIVLKNPIDLRYACDTLLNEVFK